MCSLYFFYFLRFFIYGFSPQQHINYTVVYALLSFFLGSFFFVKSAIQHDMQRNKNKIAWLRIKN